MKRSLATLIGVFTIVAPTAANATFIHGILTDCSDPNHATLRTLPGEDARIAGDKYAPLPKRDLAVAQSVAEQLFGASQGNLSEVTVIYFYGTTDSGNQWRKQGVWPVNELRRLSGTCSNSPAQSLGQKGSTSFAFVDVTCAQGRNPWNSMRVGVAIEKGAVSTICLNVGEPAVVSLPDAARRPERGN